MSQEAPETEITKKLNAPFAMNELDQAIKQAKNGKTGGAANIPYEFSKKPTAVSKQTILSLYNKIWTEKKDPKGLEACNSIASAEAIKGSHETQSPHTAR